MPCRPEGSVLRAHPRNGLRRRLQKRTATERSPSRFLSLSPLRLGERRLTMADLAVILGATGGLGSAVVDAFAMRGDRVIAVARSRADVSALAAKYPISPSPSGGGQGGGVTGDTANLTSRQDVDELWERIDRVGVP